MLLFKINNFEITLNISKLHSMIDTTELRIGNLVYRLGVAFPLCVEEISKNEIVVSFLESKEMCEKRPVTEFEGIPLTKEWLLKFGFLSNEDYSPMCYGNGTIGGFFDGKYFHYDISRVQYVHQLQNLYNSLTGEELISKTVYFKGIRRLREDIKEI